MAASTSPSSMSMLRGQVALRVAVAERHVVRLVVDDRRAGLHALARVEDGGQLLVLDLDQGQRALGDLLGLGGHRGHAVAHVAHLAVQAEEVERAGDRVGLAGGASATTRGTSW